MVSRALIHDNDVYEPHDKEVSSSSRAAAAEQQQQ
jgi:hypothetical protein